MEVRTIGVMQDTNYTIDVDELMREIERYLAVVEAFRAAGCDVGALQRRRGRKHER